MRIIYMGTPDFAVNALVSLVDAGHEVVACYTQPDKPKGRSKALQPTPVKVKALEYGIPVYQPVKLRESENVEKIMQYAPDAIVVAAYGQILPESILNIPAYGCINIHASLLPKYRGAAPIERAIIDGESETGVTTMYMAKGLDTGDIIEQSVVPIMSDDTGETLTDKLAKTGAELILSTLDKLENGTAERTVQNDDESCYAAMLSKDMGDIDFTRPADEIETCQGIAAMALRFYQDKRQECEDIWRVCHRCTGRYGAGTDHRCDKEIICHRVRRGRIADKETPAGGEETYGCRSVPCGKQAV